MSPNIPINEAYDRWAGTYHSDGNPLVALDDMVVPPCVGPVRGLHVLELGCGTGRHTRRLVDGGARVTAVDFSSGMLARARAEIASDMVTFVEHDLQKALPFERAGFDLVLSCLVLEHIADMSAVFREARRVCKPAAAIVISDMHQALRLNGKQANFDDSDTGENVRVDGFEHPVSEYVMAAIDAGLQLESIAEYKGDARLAKAFPRMARYVGTPMLVVPRARVPD
jgi:malonyl-CoA O-methyltransferase